MAGGDVADRAIEGYLDAVAAGLVGPRAARTAILDELRDGLHEAAANHARRGESPEGAVRAALGEFGAPAMTAAAFAGELAGSRARATVAGYLGTGPLVGLLWLLLLVPSGWWRHGPAALWAAIPPAPVFGLACGTGLLVLAATGRASRWLPLPPRHILHGALVVAAAAIVGDLLMLVLVLVLVARSDATASPSTIGVLAVTASVIRLGFGIPAAARCLRTRRTVTC